MPVNPMSSSKGVTDACVKLHSVSARSTLWVDLLAHVSYIYLIYINTCNAINVQSIG